MAGSSPIKSGTGVRPWRIRIGPPSPAPSIAGVLRHIPVAALFADVVFFVVAVALGGVERDLRFAAGALVALVVFGNGLDGFRFCHARSPALTRRDNAGRGARVPGSAAPFINIKFSGLPWIVIPVPRTSLILLASCPVRGAS